MVRQQVPDIVHIFNNTTCEYPETLKFIEEQKKAGVNIITTIPKDRNGKVIDFKRVVKEYGYPMFSKRVASTIAGYKSAKTEEIREHRQAYIDKKCKKYDKYKTLPINDVCCKKMKKRPAQKIEKELGLECKFVGLLAEESGAREKFWIENGCNAFNLKEHNQSMPLAFWTEQDIYEYIERYNLKIADLYKMGYTRNGCMFCGFGVQLEGQPNRWQKLAKTHPKQYKYFVDNFGELIKKFDVPFEEIKGEELEKIDEYAERVKKKGK